MLRSTAALSAFPYRMHVKLNCFQGRHDAINVLEIGAPLLIRQRLGVAVGLHGVLRAASLVGEASCFLVVDAVCSTQDASRSLLSLRTAIHSFVQSLYRRSLQSLV